MVAFGTPPVRVVDIEPPSLSIVVHQDDDGVVINTLLLQIIKKPTDVVIEVSDHTEVLGTFFVHVITKWCDELLRRLQRIMQ